MFRHFFERLLSLFLFLEFLQTIVLYVIESILKFQNQTLFQYNLY